MSLNMHQVTLQAYPYRNYHERCARQGRWDDLRALVENALSNPQVPVFFTEASERQL